MPYTLLKNETIKTLRISRFYQINNQFDNNSLLICLLI